MSRFLVPAVDNGLDLVEVPEHGHIGYPSPGLAPPRTHCRINLETPLPPRCPYASTSLEQLPGLEPAQLPPIVDLTVMTSCEGLIMEQN